MRTVHADLRTCYWGNPITGAECSFRPTGRLHTIGEEMHVNPDVEWRSGKRNILAARLFVGLSVNKKPRWQIRRDVIPIVVRVRKQQGHIPDSSFLSQSGVYTSLVDGKWEVEKSVQIIIANTTKGMTQRKFQAEMMLLAEELATVLLQESVILEVQVNGLSKEVLSIRARAKA